MSCSGRCHSASDQSTGGIWGARSKSREALIRSSCDVSRGNIGRTWFCSPYQPRDEEHLYGAATVPVALLVVRLHAPDARAEALDVHRGVRRIAERGNGQLIFGRRRAAGRANLAVGPRLLRQPVERVGAVGDRRARMS